MKKDAYAMIPFIIGIALAGFCYWLSEATFLDNRVKYPDSTFNTIQTFCTIGMIVGGLIFAWSATLLFGIWKRKPEE